MNNATIARYLTAHADSLGQRGSDLYRRRAFRQAVESLQRLERPAEQILAQSGRAGLEALPGIGRSLARAIEELITTGTFRPRVRRRLPCGLVELRPSA